jgi:hypothetical protein
LTSSHSAHHFFTKQASQSSFATNATVIVRNDSDITYKPSISTITSTATNPEGLAAKLTEYKS